MERITDAFVWPFRDPDWLGRVAVIGLILLVPIAGDIVGLGWMIGSIRRLRAGEERLAPLDSAYLGAGFQLFVVYVVYYFVLAVIAAVLSVPAVVILSQQGRDSSNPALEALGVGLLLLTFSVVTLGVLALTFAMPAIVLAVDHGGIGAGLRVDQIVRRMRASILNTLIAGLMLIAAGLIGQLGSVVCIVGVVFTSAYALAMQAWIIRSYELGSSTPAKT
jgi:Protein of unknown function (DUF4013)